MRTHIPRPVFDGDTAIRRSLRLLRPRTADQLHAYLRVVLGFRMPRVPMVSDHDAPFDYLLHAYFEGDRHINTRTSPVGQTLHAGRKHEPHLDAFMHRRAVVSRDCIVWANRGGGKTQLGAIATLLDMLFKPGIQIIILGGSFEQSSKMHRYLRRLAESEVFSDLIEGNCTGRLVELANGSRVEVLSQSERAIRGQRVHKLRCDEVELFDTEVWEAAQLVTRSGWCGDTYVHGCIEALSTMHKPYGLMQKLIAEAEHSGRRVFRWSVLDVLRHCPPQRACESCALWSDCQARAKLPAARGFLNIDDAIRQHHRVGLHVWCAEMLCIEPDRSNSVYPEFDVKSHVADDEAVGDRESAAGSRNSGRRGPIAEGPGHAFIGGIDFGIRAPTVVLWAVHDRANDVITVVDELVVRDQTTEQVIAQAIQRMGDIDIVWFFAKNQSCLDATATASRAIGAMSTHRDSVESPQILRRSEGDRSAAQFRVRRAAWRSEIADSIEGGRGGGGGWFGVDPAGHARNEQTGVSTIAVWKRAGFTIRSRTSDIATGVSMVRARLRRADGSVGLRIHVRCHHLIEAMRMYHYPDHRSPSSHADPDRNVPVKDGPDHACDALRYMIINMDSDARQAQIRPY